MYRVNFSRISSFLPPHSYNLILVEGLPDWRQPIFYYRRVRKMGLLELSVLLMVIGSVGQYLFGLAVYVEKKLVMVSLVAVDQSRLTLPPGRS